MNNKEIKESNKEEIKQETKKKFSKEELKARVREANLNYEGQLSIDEKYKKPDKVLRIDNDDPATRKKLEKLGYTIVIDRDIEVGSGSLREPGNMGSAIHVEQAIYGKSQPGIVYEIDKDLYEARKEVEAEENDMNLQQTIEDGQSHIPDHLKSSFRKK